MRILLDSTAILIDLMLVAQCLLETAYLLTHDKQLQKYGKVVTVV